MSIDEAKTFAKELKENIQILDDLKRIKNV
jgi:hypothetical protein